MAIELGSLVKCKPLSKKSKPYTGVVVSLAIPEYPTVEDHGMVELWLSNVTGHGCNNCEHYTYTGYGDYFGTVVPPVPSSGLYIGKLVKTKFGRGMIVKLDNDTTHVYLYFEDNNHDPIYLIPEVCPDIDWDALDDGTLQRLIDNESKFNSDTFCLELLDRDLEYYLI